MGNISGYVPWSRIILCSKYPRESRAMNTDHWSQSTEEKILTCSKLIYLAASTFLKSNLIHLLHYLPGRLFNLQFRAPSPSHWLRSSGNGPRVCMHNKISGCFICTWSWSTWVTVRSWWAAHCHEMKHVSALWGRCWAGSLVRLDHPLVDHLQIVQPQHLLARASLCPSPATPETGRGTCCCSGPGASPAEATTQHWKHLTGFYWGCRSAFRGLFSVWRMNGDPINVHQWEIPTIW